MCRWMCDTNCDESQAADRIIEIVIRSEDIPTTVLKVCHITTTEKLRTLGDNYSHLSTAIRFRLGLKAR